MLRVPVRVSCRQWLLVLIVLGGLVHSVTSMNAGAIDKGWLSGNLKSELISDQDYDTSIARCRTEIVEVQGGPRQEMCLYQAKSFQWAQYFEYPGTYLRTVIRFNNEQRMHLIDNFVDGSTYTTYGFLLSGNGSDDLTYNRWGTTWTIKNLPSHLSRSMERPGRLIFDPGSMHQLSVDEKGNHADTYTGAISQNGKWMALMYQRAGIVKVNLETYDMTLVTQDGLGERFMFDMAISNDGRHIAIMGDNWYPARVIDTGGECGIKAGALLQAWKSPVDFGQHACHQRDISEELQEIHGGSYVYAHAPMFAPGDEELYLRLADRVKPQAIRLLASTYDETKLDYLALGDSYSSGEGDLVEKGSRSHYLAGTEEPGKCHLSDRSYPFLLRNEYQISDRKMKSVACSGAQVVMDYLSRPAIYKGQHGELLGLSADMRDATRQVSLNDGTPGVVPQLEFVEKYKPTTVTLTGGGNDVGFSDILTYCATPAWEGFFYDDTCGYALKGSELERILYDAIDTQYGYTKKLLSSIQTASPNTRTIVIGYPSFVSETSAGFCSDQVAGLNVRERTMMNEAVSYMNGMLRRAARDSGATYVDIEKVLHGGRMCEGGEYVSGLADTKLYKQSSSGDKYQEAFHPNAEGHRKIAEQVIEQNAFFENNFDQEASYVVPQDIVGTVQVQDAIDGGEILRDGSFVIHFDSGTFEPHSSITISAHSTPTDLGVYEAKEDGSLVVNVSAANLAPGRHVIIMEGSSYGGEDIRYTQFATVRFSREDADGDGILDSDDHCVFMNTWIDEELGHDICTVNSEDKDGRASDGGILLSSSTDSGRNQGKLVLEADTNNSSNEKAEKLAALSTSRESVSKENDNNIQLGVGILILATLGVIYGIKKFSEIGKK